MLHITPDERQALQLLSDGTTTDAIADRLAMSERKLRYASARFLRGWVPRPKTPPWLLPSAEDCLSLRPDGRTAAIRR